ncbi:MAG: hypothetical protein CSB44_04640 [Gammaproteobacteria bacterium]|nr:MAG: hypothetical protein CSB44_04640 [Gammaproteobacteria bacterium]
MTLVLSLGLLCASSVIADTNRLTSAPAAASVLDQPINLSGQPAVLNPDTSPTPAPVPPGLHEENAEPVIDIETPNNLDELRDDVAREQAELDKLPQADLEERAELGQRSAQVALAEEYAREASQLAFAPVAANDALSDAVRMYNLAASRGFPGAPSLDMAGVKFYPIRAQR